MTARDVKRSALGMGRILLGVVMAIFVPVWLVFSLVDFTRPTVPTNELVAPSVEVHDETGSFGPVDGRSLTEALGDVKFTRPVHLLILSAHDPEGRHPPLFWRGGAWAGAAPRWLCKRFYRRCRAVHPGVLVP